MLFRKIFHLVAVRGRTIWFDVKGTSAIEFSFFAGLLSFALLNTADISIYVYKRMQVENAAQMAAQTIFKLCDPSKGYLPATTSCPGLNTAVTNAIQSTSLGSNVTLQSGSLTEAWYCVNSSGSLQYVSAVSSKPVDCTAAGMSTLQPGDYVQLTATFSYSPLFSGVTVASAFSTPVTKTTMMRLQ
jgi:Flp pilus assembly protein TadG